MAFSPIKLIFGSAVLLPLLSLSLLACSYADGHLPPTKYDLIKRSEAIVLARPTVKRGYIVDFDVVEVLKGDFQGKSFQGSEMHTSCADYSYEVDLKLNLPPPFDQKLPKVSHRYVLFLAKTKKGWGIWSPAADAMNGLVTDVNSSTFLKTVRHFIRVSSLNNYETEKSELKKLRQQARSGRDTREFPKDLIELVDHHLETPTASKSYSDLVNLYSHSTSEKKKDVLWAFAWGGHKEAAKFFTTLTKSAVPLDYVGPISEYVTRTRNEPLLVKLGKAYPKLDKNVRWPIMWALVKTAGIQHEDLMLAAIRSADKEEAGRLAEWFVRHPVNEATSIVRALVGNDYQENYELTFELAGMGDNGALNWARTFMNSPHEDRWMAYYTIAYSPVDEADRLARSVISGNDPKGMVYLIQGYKDSNNPNRWDRLRDLVNLQNRAPDVDYWLREVLEEMADEGDKTSPELLKTLRLRQQSGVAQIL